MNRLPAGILSITVGMLLAASLAAQTSPSRPSRLLVPSQRNQADRNKRTSKEEAKPQLPTDPRLLELHRDFLVKAERLAKDYERADQSDRARAVYQEMIRLVPQHPTATEALAELDRREQSADRKVLEVQANRGWQDTGVEVIQGKPIAVRATGQWEFRVSRQLGPDGMEIPKELRDFNLGALVGIIDSEGDEDVKPFFVGSERNMIAEQSGRLWLRMYDMDPADNAGKLTVEIRGTFRRR